MEIKSVADYLKHVLSFEQQHISQWLFRGVRDANYDLIPSLFRIDITNTLTNWKDLEKYMLRIFKRESIPFLEIIPQDELELITLAQHYGLPTRLLDWSTNPLIALFFALECFDRNIDSAVWCYGVFSTHNCHPESTRIDRRLDIERGVDKIVFPNHISQRIANQSGCFTLHNLPEGREKFIPFGKQDYDFGIFDKLIIKKEYQKDIMQQLFDLGYHYGLIYPGLDGLSKRIKFEVLTHKRCSNENQLKKIEDLLEKKYYKRASEHPT